ncbi:hypothetical protein AB0424_28450 [Streptomyces sp. NPDC051180]|uniref:hypothetical protein n=1 Tax=unclassified Streptomyces TaxID=2593676 RepID=UPI00344BEFE2
MTSTYTAGGSVGDRRVTEYAMSPKKQSTAGKKARAAARQGEKFTTALRRETAGLSPAELNALGVADAKAHAASFADKDDWDWDTRRARQEWEEVQWWERMRAGGEVRIWNAVIETRAAALNADDAWHRLSLYMRSPIHRRGDEPLLHMTWEIGNASSDEVAERGYRHELDPLAPGALSEEERRRLEADYPRGVFAHLGTRGEHYGAWEQAHVADYCQTLDRAARRIEQGRGLTEKDLQRWVSELDAERGPLPDGVKLTYWRAHFRVEFLAGYDEASARRRAEELAATVVDYAGRPIGRVVDGTLEPEDGFRSAVDGRWVHPAASGLGELGRRALWEDYAEVEARTAAGEPVGSLPVLRDMYRLAAEQLRDAFARSTGDYTAHEAKLHTQPDGTRTYTSPGMMRQVTANARAEAEGKTPAELREMAEHADYMARRVYGKVVQNDEDVRRIEAAEQRARVWAKLADDIEAITTLAGEAAAGWPLLGVTWLQTGREDGPQLEVWAETADGDTDLVGLWPLGEDDRPVGAYHVVLQTAPGRAPRTAPYPVGFIPPNPAKGAASERWRWLGIEPS